MSFCTRGS
jgi:colicin import membrane protein